ncbi:hypothetical protein [Brucella rhizosphaerae]|uniref:Uncharacterized protein n=1 Tax=Brucella rhizosphaerae TaxID=571254 RepID=A0A256FKU8_9HYPH|nr:hypothetical protein [Brucella rhizosphaerae]OYR15483.1 hypothetical protein CEV32_4758 [Brucella rhizosphaerae]
MQTLKERAEKLADDLRFGHYNMATAIAMIRELAGSLNTRPAAPVEGLETVAYQYKIPRNGHWDNLPSDWTADECKAYGKYETRELVTLTQAEAIIAAKDESIKDAKLSRDDWKKLAIDLGADNAALTARVKELELIRDSHSRDTLQALLEKQALETQLTAARKALDIIFTNPRSDCAIRAARATLEAKP